MKARWPVIALGVLLLAVLAAWGSRERTWSKQVDSLTIEIKTVTSESETLRSQVTQLRKDSETAETIEPVLLPNGQVAYITHRTSKTVEMAMSQSNEQIKDLTKQIDDLKAKSTTKETETVKSAPMWNVVVGWEPTTATYYAGAGVNLGPLSLDLDNPLSLQLRPRLTGMIRF